MEHRDELVLALDQGTTSSKALALDASGRVVASAARPLSIRAMDGGRVEQDLGELWRSVADCAADVAGQVGAGRIVAIGVTNQRESVGAWTQEGTPLAPLVSWQDARASQRAATLVTAENCELVRRVSGLELNALYSALKLAWLLDHTASSAAGPARIGTVDTWLVDRLTGGATYAIEAGNASRTLLLDVTTRDWNDELCALFGVDRAALPPVVDSDARWGVTSGVAGLPDGIPITAVLGDSHAALNGHWSIAPDHAETPKATYGTGSSIMAGAPEGSSRRPGVSTTLAWVLGGRAQYAYEGNILYSGAGLDWLARTLGLTGGADLSRLGAEATNMGCTFVPALGGIGAPWWAPGALGTLTGLTAGTERTHIARAGLESVAHQVCDVVDAMDPAGEFGALHAGGGATASDVLMQIQANLLGRTLLVARTPDISSVGVAVAAGRSVGFDIAPPADAVRRIEPDMTFTPTHRHQARAQWRDALERAGVPAPAPEPTTPSSKEQ